MANTFPASGNAGVGTASPSYLLQVAGGDIDIDNGQALRSGGDALITNNGSNLIQVGSGNASHALALLAGGSEKARVATDGKVGIGTASPAYLLDVAGDARATGSLIEKFRSFTPTTVGWYRIISDGTHERIGGIVRIFIPNKYDNTYTDIEFQFTQPAYGQLGVLCQTRHMDYNNGAVSQARASSSSASVYLDIYVSTATSPQPIYLYGFGPGMVDFVSSPTVGATAGSAPVVLPLGAGLRTTGSATAGVLVSSPNIPLMVLESTSDSYAEFDLKSNGKFWHFSKRPSGQSDRFGIYFHNGSSYSSELVTIATNGNVGIGTTSPGAKLEVVGSTASNDIGVGTGSSGSGNNTWLTIGRSADTGGCAVLEAFLSGVGGTAIALNPAYGGKVGFGTGSPVSLCANTNSNIQDSNSTGIAGAALAWRVSAIGYTAAFDNTDSSSGNRNGILVKSAATDTGSYLLRVESGGNNRLTVRADGNVGIGTNSPSAKLQVEGDTYLDGGQRVKVSTVSANTTLDGTYHTVIVDSSGGSKTITLPSASSHSGREYRVKNKGANAVTISGTIDGKSGGLQLNMNDAATLISDGSNWYIF